MLRLTWSRTRNGNVLDVRLGINGVLWVLHDDVVLNAILWIQVVHGSYLKAAAERHEHAVDHVTLGESALRSLRPVDDRVALRGVLLLVAADVGDASDVTEILQYGWGYCPISRDVGC